MKNLIHDIARSVADGRGMTGDGTLMFSRQMGEPRLMVAATCGPSNTQEGIALRLMLLAFIATQPLSLCVNYEYE